jgi:hypothetical protein
VLQPFAYRGPRWKLHSVIWVLNSVATFLFLALHVAGRTSSNDIPLGVFLVLVVAVPAFCLAAVATFLWFILLCYPEVAGSTKLQALLSVGVTWGALLLPALIH